MSKLMSCVNGGLLSVAVLLTGCGESGPPVGTVTGVVTLDGQPLPNATIAFTPEQGGQTAQGKTDSSGRYVLYRRGEEGALVGTNKVVIRAKDESANAPGTQTDIATDSAEYLEQATGGGSTNAYNNATPPKDLVPDRYNTNSELVANVVSGENTFDFELQSN